MDDLYETFAECKIDQRDTNKETNEQVAIKPNEQLSDVQEYSCKTNGQVDRRSENELTEIQGNQNDKEEIEATTSREEQLKIQDNQKLCKTKSNEEQPNINDKVATTSNEERGVEQGTNIIERLKNKISEAKQANEQLEKSPPTIMSKDVQLFRILRDEVFSGENFSHPVLHLYEGKLNTQSDIAEFVKLWGSYQFVICQRLKLYIQRLPFQETDDEFICKKTYRSLIELFGNCSEQLEMLVQEILEIIFYKFPDYNKELLNICQFNLIDYNLGLRSSNGVPATLRLVHYMFLTTELFISKADLKLYQNVILILFKNMEYNFANTLRLFIIDYLHLYDQDAKLWGITFRYLFKYWNAAAKAKSRLYAAFVAQFLIDIPDRALRTHSAVIFESMEIVLKHSESVTFETRIELRDALMKRGFSQFIQIDFPWIFNYFFYPLRND